MNKKCNVGGQAVIEGVMMRGEKGIATAVRTSNGNIEVSIDNNTPLNKKNKLFSLPIIRGFISLLDSLIVGIKNLNYSASFFEDGNEEPDAVDKFLNKIFKDKTDDVLIGFTLFISLCFSILLFFIAPTFIAQGFKRIGANNITLNIVEGLLRVGIFLAYILFISKMNEINRLFQYHGAEHKTIFCYENGEELNVENVKKYSRLHPRCGTNFIFLVMVISILFFSFISWNSFLYRICFRIILLPLVAGITYEIIRWLGKNDNKLTEIIAYPGLKLQELTTKEPEDDQIEVAITALKNAEGIKPKKKTIGELLSFSNKILKENNIESYVLDSQLLLGKILERDRLYLITNREEYVDLYKEEQFKKLVEKRKNKMPTKYILGESEFMGINFFVKEGVLIPRPDTEILVEKVLEITDKEKLKNICDLCCGSGAIGLSLAYLREYLVVTCVDIEDIPEEVTKENIKRLNLDSRAKFIHSNLFDNIIKENLKYEIIVSNPPYIRSDVIPTLMDDVKNYEPNIALDGGEDGLYFYKQIINESKKVLLKQGYLLFEIGYDQGNEVQDLMISAGYSEVRVLKDLAGLDRIVIGKNMAI
ncbi:protein-(glutamine-N5) methyltransferase, release factor-specific [Clostridium frigidicarnis]|uniref:Release factor glutamine methyltransferase n=2 Tax=Clostridium frigidicarnis TaxID=84698 RepID=A0A1I0ZEV4_9CLOT|nr:protein-(glutamine-N5) methyltransferase, release factor-specific [Clostridium frigidicarnis]